MSKIGEMIRELRKKSGLTQSELAEKLEISFSTLRRWEVYDGQPQANEIKKLCEVLHCTESELLNGQKRNDWDLRLVIAREGEEIDMTTMEPDATLSIKDKTMTVSLTAGYDLWEDDAKFDGLIEMLKARRSAGLRLRKESW